MEGEEDNVAVVVHLVNNTSGAARLVCPVGGAVAAAGDEDTNSPARQLRYQTDTLVPVRDASNFDLG